MRKFIQLDIPEPCHEKWNHMDPVKKGRFCNACQKKVIDFRNMSDEELLKFFLDKRNRHACGNFNHDQLQRVITQAAKPVAWFRYILASLFPALLFSVRAKAQSTQVKPLAEISPQQQITAKKSEAVSISITEGRIADNSGNGIAGASVELLPGRLGAVTDSNGRFSIKTYEVLPLHCQIRISSVGYAFQSMTLEEFKRRGSEVILGESIPMLGEVVVAAPHNTRCSLIMGAVSVRTKVGVVDSLKQWIWPVKAAAKLFPNPVERGRDVHVTAKFEKGTRYHFTMADIMGRVVADKFLAGNISTVFSFSIPSTIGSGTFIVTMRDDKGATLLSDKVIIQ